MKFLVCEHCGNKVSQCRLRAYVFNFNELEWMLSEDAESGN